MQQTENFLKLLKHPIKFPLFLLLKLPAAFFSGVKIREADEQYAVTAVPYKWLTQNPFKSTYFASLAMAAELSTGILAMLHIHERKPAVSMLVTGLTADYFKKATCKTYFTCNDGTAIKLAIEKAIASGEPVSINALSTGKNSSGEIIATFQITWSFKVKRTSNNSSL